MYNLYINKLFYTKMLTLNECFIQLRENVNLTQSDFAKKIGVSRSTIAKIENNEIEVSKKNLFNLWQNFPDEFEKFEVLKKELPKQQAHINTLEIKFQVESLINLYKKNIEEIEYYNSKIKTTVSSLNLLGADLTEYNNLLELLDKNLNDLKETYNAYLVYSIISNDDLIKHPKVYNEILKSSSISRGEIEKVGINVLETYKATFDKVYDLLISYVKLNLSA